MAIDELADVGIFFSDFNETANIVRQTDLDIPGIDTLIDRDVDIIADDRLTVTKSTLIHFRKDQLLSGTDTVMLDEGDVVVLLDSGGAETDECYTLNNVISEDVSIVTWRAR